VAVAVLPSVDLSNKTFGRRAVPAGVVAYEHTKISVQATKAIKDAYDVLVPNPKQERTIFELVGELDSGTGGRRKLEFLHTGTNVQDNVLARMGRAFLVKEVPADQARIALGIREIPLPRDSEGKLTGDVEIPTVDQGEFLVFVLLLEPAQGGVLPKRGEFELKVR
jgi:hypothetical protein